MENESFALTPQQQRHLAILEAIAREMHDTPLVLKGGSALVLGYRQQRFTEDLDFDSPRKLNLERRIQTALDKVKARILPIDNPRILKPKDTRYGATLQAGIRNRGGLAGSFEKSRPHFGRAQQ